MLWLSNDSRGKRLFALKNTALASPSFVPHSPPSRFDSRLKLGKIFHRLSEPLVSCKRLSQLSDSLFKFERATGSIITPPAVRSPNQDDLPDLIAMRWRRSVRRLTMSP